MARQQVTPLQIRNPIKFSAYRAAAGSVANTATVVYDTKVYDTGNNYSTSTGEFTAPVDGFYWFSAQIGLAAYTLGNHYWVSVLKNGVEAYRLARGQSASTSNFSPTGSVEMQLLAGDKVKIAFSGGTTATMEVGISITWFMGELRSMS